ncbi:MAG: RluA family pseudouridine synthase [Paludibacteraceae bacterium]|nr:RluA family pseudouridine synthase [Paludibacteraceae bacterium]
MKQPKNKQTRLRVHESTLLMPFLLLKMGGMSRQSVKQLLSHRQVSVNGEIQTRFDLQLNQGDEIVIDSQSAKQELRHPKLKIIYEDEALIVCEKKRGLLTVPTIATSKETTCFSILKHYVRQANPRARIYVVHRLDRETSGLLVFAKTPELQHYMRDYWKELVTKRTYIAVAEGVIDQQEGQIKTWFTEDKRNAVVYSSPVDDGGQLAITNYRVIKTNEKYSLVELHLETGRTNQIRVHLASIGHPVLGDRKYGSGNPSPIDRLALHARIVEFIHPLSEQIVHFETPVPREFLKLFH